MTNCINDFANDFPNNLMNNDIEKLSMEFYDIMTTKRYLLPDFLNKYGNYETLKSILCLLESKQHNIKNLLLGYSGLEINKQRGIYELVTRELIEVVISLCHLLGIKKIEELYAGQGLFSKMLKIHSDLDVKATDGCMWTQTMGQPKFVNVKKKLILNYLSKDYDFNKLKDKMLLISWIAANSIKDFLTFMDIVKPRQFIIVGESFHKEIKDIIKNARKNNYRIFYLSVKQICHKDHFYYNKFFPNNSCRSSLTLFVRNDTNIKMDNILQKCRQHLCIRRPKYTDKMVLEDLINEKYFPKWVYDLLNHRNNLFKFLFHINKVINKKITWPEYFTNFEDFEFWYRKKMNNKYPKYILNKEKFDEYRDIVLCLESNNGIRKLKDRFVLPNWINNAEEAEKYIWLDFSTRIKTWKQSYSQFMEIFNIVYTRVCQADPLG